MAKSGNEDDKSTSMPQVMKKPKQYHPVDKGWAWVIMIASFGVHVMSMGYQRSFGMLFVEFQAKYSSSSAMTSAINGAQSFSYCFLTLLVMNYVVGRLSVRTTCFIGCLFQAAGVAASSLVPNPVYLIVTQGILFGCGHALLYCPTLLILSQYFERRRPIATTISSCGASVGGIVFPLITRKLIEAFGLQGSLLILSGLMLQQLLCVIVYTPPSDYLPLDAAMDIASDDITIDGESECSNNQTAGDLEKLLQPMDLGRINQDPLGYNSDSNNNGKSQENLKQKPLFIAKPGLIHDLVYVSESHDHLAPQSVKLKKNLELNMAARSHQLLPVSSHFHPHHKQCENNEHEMANGSQILKALSRSSIDQITSSMPSLLINDIVTLNKRYHPPHHNTQASDQYGDHQMLKAGDHGQDGKLSRQIQHNADLECQATCSNKRCMALPEILKLPKFWILSIFFACGATGTGLPAIFIPPLAKERGLTDDNAAFLLIVSSSVDMVGRLLPGFILHFNVMRPSTLMIIPLVVGGTAFHMTSLFNDFLSILAFTIVYGVMSSSFWPLQTLIVIEILGLERLASSMGFYAIFIGVAAGASYPVGGAVRDLTLTYSTTFHYFGCLYYAAAVAIISLQFMRKIEDSNENDDEEVCDANVAFIGQTEGGDAGKKENSHEKNASSLESGHS